MVQPSQLTQRSLMMLADVPIIKLRKEIGARLVLNRLEALIRKRSALDDRFHSQKSGKFWFLCRWTLSAYFLQRSYIMQA